MSELSPYLQPLARGMLTEKIINFPSADTKANLKSGKKSAVYVDGRDIPSFPKLNVIAVGAYIDLLRNSGMIEKNEDRGRILSAVPQGPFSINGAVGLVAGVPVIQRRIGEKTHGKNKRYQGRYQIGAEVVMLEDTASTGMSIIEEADSLITSLFNPIGAVALVDREMGARTLLTEHGYEFEAAMTLRSILQYGLAEGMKEVTQTKYDEVMAELDPIEVAQNDLKWHNSSI
jgi:orotate phosphoribosyltransferase